MRILAATSIHSKDVNLPQILRSLHELCAFYSALHAVINLFDEQEPTHTIQTLKQSSTWLPDRYEVTWVAGMKTLFWKRILTPERTRAATVVWLFDADIAVHPTLFPLGQIVSSMLALNASAVQPSIRAYSEKEADARWPMKRLTGSGTIHSWLLERPTHISCVANTAKVCSPTCAMFWRSSTTLVPACSADSVCGAPNATVSVRSVDHSLLRGALSRAGC